MPEYAPIVKKKLLCEHTIPDCPEKRNCLEPRHTLYSPCMSNEQDDLNAFNSWDCFGAALMLGVVPGIICYATTDPHDVKKAIGLCVLGVIVALVVLAVALITRWRILGSIVNMAGTILTPLFIIYVTLFWVKSCNEYTEKRNLSIPTQSAQTTQPARQQK